MWVAMCKDTGTLRPHPFPSFCRASTASQTRKTRYGYSHQIRSSYYWPSAGTVRAHSLHFHSPIQRTAEPRARNKKTRSGETTRLRCDKEESRAGTCGVHKRSFVTWTSPQAQFLFIIIENYGCWLQCGRETKVTQTLCVLVISVAKSYAKPLYAIVTSHPIHHKYIKVCIISKYSIGTEEKEKVKSVLDTQLCLLWRKANDGWSG